MTVLYLLELELEFERLIDNVTGKVKGTYVCTLMNFIWWSRFLLKLDICTIFNCFITQCISYVDHPVTEGTFPVILPEPCSCYVQRMCSSVCKSECILWYSCLSVCLHFLTALAVRNEYTKDNQSMS